MSDEKSPDQTTDPPLKLRRNIEREVYVMPISSQLELTEEIVRLRAENGRMREALIRAHRELAPLRIARRASVA